MQPEKHLICDIPCKLLVDTIQLIKDDPRDLETIYVETGVPYSFLKKLVAPITHKNPSVNKITYLHTVLTAKKNSI